MATDHDLLVRIDERVGDLLTHQKDQERRIRALERWRNALGAAVSATGLGVIAQALGLQTK